MTLILKNKAEREEFLKNYRKWGVLYEMLELQARYYRYDFSTGAHVIITEYGGSKTDYSGRKYVKNKYWLYVPAGDEWLTHNTNLAETHSVKYDPSGCGMGIIVDYMTKNRDNL